MSKGLKKQWYTVSFFNPSELPKFLNYYGLKPGDFHMVQRGPWTTILYYWDKELKKLMFYGEFSEELRDRKNGVYGEGGEIS